MHLEASFVDVWVQKNAKNLHPDLAGQILPLTSSYVSGRPGLSLTVGYINPRPPSKIRGVFQATTKKCSRNHRQNTKSCGGQKIRLACQLQNRSAVPSDTLRRGNDLVVLTSWRRRCSFPVRTASKPGVFYDIIGSMSRTAMSLVRSTSRE